MTRDAIFNRRRRRLLRTTIPAGEGAVGLVVLGVLVGVVMWVLGQRDAYDPDRRDLPLELLEAERPVIEIYKRPLKPWIEPGTELTVAAPGAALAPFPETLADGAWQPKGRVRAFGPENLYEKINGEAEKFLKQGFVSMHYLVLRHGEGAELAVELYDQGDVGGSAGIFADHAGAGREIDERDGVTYFLTTAGVIGRTGRWFFRAAADRSDPTVTAKAASMVDALARLGDGPGAGNAETPAGLAILLRAGLAESAVEYQASNVFQFDFASDFWFGQLEGDARVFVHVAEDPETAGALMAAVVEEQSYDFGDIHRGEDSTVMRHAFLGTWFAIARDGRYLLGAENLPDEDAVRPALGRVAGALESSEGGSSEGSTGESGEQ